MGWEKAGIRLFLFLIFLMFLLPVVSSEEPDKCADALSGANPGVTKYGTINHSTDKDWFKGVTLVESLLEITLNHFRYDNLVYKTSQPCSIQIGNECGLTGITSNTGYNTCTYGLGPENHYFEVSSNSSTINNGNYNLIIKNKCSSNQCADFTNKKCFNQGSTTNSSTLYCDSQQTWKECTSQNHVSCQQKGNYYCVLSNGNWKWKTCSSGCIQQGGYGVCTGEQPTICYQGNSYYTNEQGNPTTIATNCGTTNCDQNISAKYCSTDKTQILQKFQCYTKGCTTGSCFNNPYQTTQTIETCQTGTTCKNANCTSNTITCFNNNDCLDVNFFNPVCSGNNIEQTKRTYTCQNPGTANSFCQSNDQQITTNNCEDTGQTCQNGKCIGSPLWAPSWWSDLEKKEETSSTVIYSQTFNWNIMHMNYFKDGNIDFMYDLVRLDSDGNGPIDYWDFFREGNSEACDVNIDPKNIYWSDLPGKFAGNSEEANSFPCNLDGVYEPRFGDEEFAVKAKNSASLIADYNYHVTVSFKRKVLNQPMKLKSEAEYCGRGLLALILGEDPFCDYRPDIGYPDSDKLRTTPPKKFGIQPPGSIKVGSFVMTEKDVNS